MTTNSIRIVATALSKKYSRNAHRSARYGLVDIWRRLVGVAANVCLRQDEFWSVHDVSFTLTQGEALAIIGNNGAGKTTLLKMLSGRLAPTKGTIASHGRVVAITELGLGFNSVLSGRENIFVYAALLGLTRLETEAALEDIIEFSGLRSFIDMPIGTYSTGMRARLGFAVAAHVEPDVLLLDELLAVGDIAFRRKCRQHLRKYVAQGGAVVLVSHDMHAVQTMCNRCLVMEQGRSSFLGPVTEGLHYYLSTQPHNVLAPEPSSNSTPTKSIVDTAQAKRASDDEVGAVASKCSDCGSADSPTNLATSLLEKDSVALAGNEKNATANGREVDQVRAVIASGSNPVAIEHVEFSGPSGEPIQQDRPATLALHYVAAHEIGNCVWGFTLCSADGETHIATGLAGFEGKTYTLQQGRGTLRCTMPRLPLCAGTYALKVGIGDAESGGALVDIGWEDQPILFSVSAPASTLNNLRSFMRNVVTIEVDWD